MRSGYVLKASAFGGVSKLILIEYGKNLDMFFVWISKEFKNSLDLVQPSKNLNEPVASRRLPSVK